MAIMFSCVKLIFFHLASGPGSNMVGDINQGSIAHSFSLSPSHCPDMTISVEKDIKSPLTHFILENPKGV